MQSTKVLVILCIVLSATYVNMASDEDDESYNNSNDQSN
jgi:hypothetical protein